MSVQPPAAGSVTQDQVYKAQDAVKDAVKNGGDVKAAIQTLVMDQADLNKTQGKSGSIADTEKYMDKWLGQNGISSADTKKFDDMFNETARDTAGMSDGYGKLNTDSLEKFADSLATSFSSQTGGVPSQIGESTAPPKQ